ncbi:MAG TPA: acetyltransferase [Planctomycetota bacterium]|nr:acetyltransferase [Planctomycetota bacterium]
MKDTIIVGVCATGRVVLDCLVASGREGEIAGFVHGRPEGTPSEEVFDGFPVLGTLADVARLKRDRGIRRAIVGVGEIAQREQLFGELSRAGLDLISAVHPTAVLTRGVELGRNVIIAPQAAVGVGTHIADGAFLNTSCSVDHDCEIGEFAHICPGTHLAGTVTVGRRTWVGIGASVVQGVTIGEDTFVGAGAVVVRDLPAGVLVYGVPGRVVRELEEGERGRIIH